jgi:predicted permease
LTRAAEHISAISPALLEATLPTDRDRAGLDRYRSFRLTALRAAEGVSRMRADYSDALTLLLALTGLVLLMACTNLMNLFLGRASAREQEIAVRIALGASRRRVIAQLFVEGLVVAISGTVVAAMLAPLFSRGLLALVSTDSNRLHLPLGPNWPVLLFTAGIGTIACLVFGLVPALRASQLDPSASMKAGTRGLTSGRRRMAIQRGLVAAQAALSLVLVVGAGLFVRSFTNLTAVDTGFDRRGVLLARLADLGDRPSPDAAYAVQQELLARVRRVPLVEAAAATTKIPLDGSSWTMAFFTPDVRREPTPVVEVHLRQPAVFLDGWDATPGGRDFSDADLPAGRQVAIVNETFVRRFLPSDHAGWTQIRTAGEPRYPSRTYDIIGVVSDTKYSDLRGDIVPITFVPFAQHPSPPAWPNLVLRASATAGRGHRRGQTRRHRAAPAHGHGIHRLRYADARGAGARAAAGVAGRRVSACWPRLSRRSAVYGVISYLIVRRRHEIAIRMALGAGRAQVVGLILRETGLLVAGTRGRARR